MKIPKTIIEKITGSTEQYEDGFIDGWKHCSSEIETTLETFLKREGDLRKENAELKVQLEIAKEALQEIKFAALQGDETSSEINCYHLASDCLLKL